MRPAWADETASFSFFLVLAPSEGREKQSSSPWPLPAPRPQRCCQMLEQGHEVNVCDYDGRSALMLACAKGHVACARALLESGADPMLRDAAGSCALMEGCRSVATAVVSELLRHGARSVSGRSARDERLAVGVPPLLGGDECAGSSTFASCLQRCCKSRLPSGLLLKTFADSIWSPRFWPASCVALFTREI